MFALPILRAGHERTKRAMAGIAGTVESLLSSSDRAIKRLRLDLYLLRAYTAHRVIESVSDAVNCGKVAPSRLELMVRASGSRARTTPRCVSNRPNLGRW